MRFKSFFSLCVLAAFFNSSFCVPNSFADRQERDDITRTINQRNARWSANDTAISQLKKEERKKRLGSHVPSSTGTEKTLIITSAAVPADLDWRNYDGNNYVTPIKEQGGCGDCWAFAATAALESNTLIAKNIPNTILDLSEQTLNSCSGAGSCGGGWVNAAADFIRDIGLPTEACNQYTATDGFCTTSCSDWLNNSYKITNWYKVNPSLVAIKYALYNYGPLVTLMAAYTDLFYYRSGIYSHEWGSLEGYHATLIVGYNDAGQYFIVKSSWGTDWGEEGYSRIAYSEIGSDTVFGIWTIAYENAIPIDFPTIGNISRDTNNPNAQNQNDKANNVAGQLSVLSGIVRDGAGNAIISASVKVGKYSATTDSKGQYVLAAINAGDYTIIVQKRGYVSVIENISLAPNVTMTRDFIVSARNSGNANDDEEADKDKSDDKSQNRKVSASDVRGPGWFMAKAEQISLEKAKAHLDARKNEIALNRAANNRHRSFMASAAADITPEIQELARALRYDPLLIYNHVRNHIDYVPYFGAVKGATLTYLDGSGNDFDQAALLIALLNESKSYNSHIGTVNYVWGVQWCYDPFLADWFGVNWSNGNAANVYATLALGGIPFDNYFASYNMTRVLRAWAEVTVDGTTYKLDPAFKSYSDVDSLSDVITSMGYNQPDFIAEATDGATITADYVKNINETRIKNKLAAYSTNLVNKIVQSYPNKSVKEVFGGRSIIQQEYTQLPTSLPASLSEDIWGRAVDIAEVHITTLRVQYCSAASTANACEGTTYFDYTFDTPDFAGKRLTISPDGSGRPQLNLEGNAVATSSSVPANVNNKLIITIDHASPAGNPANTYLDQKAAYPVKNGGTYAVIYNFGNTVYDKQLQKQQMRLDSYLVQGLSNTSEKVLGETLNIIGTTYFREFDFVNKLISGINNTNVIKHHGIGLVASDSNYYVDMRNTLMSLISKTGNASDPKSHFELAGIFYSAFEHGILEQLMGANNAVSTVKLLQIANAAGNKIFNVTSANYDAILNETSPLVYNYSSADISTLRSKVAAGYTLFLPENGSLSLNTWQGLGCISKKISSTEEELGFIIGGGYNGGYFTVDQALIIPVLPQIAIDSTLITLSATSAPDPLYLSMTFSLQQPCQTGEPIDMGSGAYFYDHADLNMGGAKPSGVDFARSYDSRLSKTKRTLGYGWTHNNDIYISTTSDAMAVLAGRQPIDTASLITALYAGLDLIKTDSAQNWLITSLAGKWAVDQLIDNAVTVNAGKKTMTFIKRFDGVYNPPPGITTQLIKNTDSTYSLQERFGTRMNFNADKKISQIVDVDGNAATFDYNSDKTLNKVTDAFGRTITLSYTSGRISAVADSAGRSVSYGYDAGNNLTSYTDVEGKQWSYGYDAGHRMTTLQNPLNITTATNVYDGMGRVKTQTAPRQSGTSATYNYYFSGFRNQEEDPAGKTLTYYYDDKGREYAQINQLGYKTIKEFDGQDHVTKIIDPRSTVAYPVFSTYDYDGNHNVTKATNSLGYWVNNTYDAQYRLTDTTDNSNAARNTHFDYDAHHHLTKITSAMGYWTGKSYFANGFPQSVTDGRGVATTFIFDDYGNPYSTQTGSHPYINYAYDTIGRMTSLTDQEGSQTGFAYDNRGLLMSKTDPLGKQATFHYDDAGRLSYKIDRNNMRIDYAYTPTSKIDTVTYPDASSVHFTYNQLDNLTSMQDAAGTATYTRDDAGRLIAMTDHFGFTTSYAYDAAGNLTELTYPGNKKVIYTYDKLNRLETVTINWLSPNLTATYTYDPTGRLSGLTQFNGSLTTPGYDNANRLISLDNRKSDSSVIASYAFTLDGNGNRTGMTRNEPLSPVLTDSNTTYTYNTRKNRLTSAGGYSFGYDDEGQIQTGYGANYTFDYEHRLKAIGSNIQFTYDGSGKRLQATRNGIVTRYVYDAGGNLLAEADGNNNITKYYIYGAGLLAMVTPEGQTYCYHYNANGSTIAMTDGSQNMVNKYAYDPFGNILSQQEAISQPFKFVGQFGVMTEPNGFYYMRARYYDPNVGRFISEDPTGFDGGDVNLMAYVGNNPVMGIDPEGKAAFWYHFFDGFRVARREGNGILDSLAFGKAVMDIDAQSSGYANKPEAHATTGSLGISPSQAMKNAEDLAALSWNSGEKALAVHIWRDMASHGGSYFPLEPTIGDYIPHILKYDLLPGGSFENVIQSRINRCSK